MPETIEVCNRSIEEAEGQIMNIQLQLDADPPPDPQRALILTNLQQNLESNIKQLRASLKAATPTEADCMPGA
jgi:hypothetical protein